MRRRRGHFDHLPPFAVEYLETVPAAAFVLGHFHQWLKGSHRPVMQLQSPEIERFLVRLAVARQTKTKSTRALDRKRALHYFDWLRDRGLLGFDPHSLSQRAHFQLPPQALLFLKTLEPTHKLKTVNHYGNAVRHLHLWLGAQSLSLRDLERAHVCSWLQELHARGLHAATRTAIIFRARVYLRWLDEQGALSKPADLLLRRGDLPKLPQYLPRPLPPDVDELLQRRFRRSRCPYQLGLLLMRRTGLRISELMSLSYDCVQIDPRGNALLKVPLGKLDNERLVPLDENTAKLVAKLRHQTRRRRTLLLETASGNKTRYEDYVQVLRKACRGIALAEPITSHRLRHTYATAMLAGGMSLLGVMKLLGHRDYRMTLRYTAISDETLITEYAEALKRNEQRYKTLLPAAAAPASAPTSTLTDLARYIDKRVKDDGLDANRARALIKRLRRLDTALRQLLRGQSR